MQQRYNQPITQVTDFQSPLATQQAKHLHTVEAGVVVPILQALLTALVIALAGAVIMAMFSQLRPHAFQCAGVLFALTLAYCWLSRQKHWLTLTSIVQRVEEVTGTDIDHDGYVGDPIRNVRVSLQREPGQTSIWTPNATDAQIQELAVGVLLRGLPLTEKTWTGPSRPFSQRQWTEFREDLIRRGMLTLKNPKNIKDGYLLTAEGETLLREFLPGEDGFLPSPTGSEPLF